MTYRDFWQPLSGLYGDSEARAIVRLLMERRFGLSMTDLACGAVERLDEEELDSLRQRLLTGEPVQYVLGEAEFCGRTFHVEPGVLIPRPETEWLCHRAVDLYKSLSQQRRGCDCKSSSTWSVLDIGTGSGCIACTLALDCVGDCNSWREFAIPDAVVAWDVSDRAIDIARRNASALGAKVTVVKQDALTPPDDVHRWDIIVSNPPYVCEKEKMTMHANVLGHEPAEALFVPDDNPLLFYRAIVRYAARALKPGGALLLEINPLYARPLHHLLSVNGFGGVEIVDDIFGKQRFAVAFSNGNRLVICEK